MTVELVLLLIVVFGIGLKFFSSAPMDAFKQSAPRLGARVEKHLASGTGFKDKTGSSLNWEDAK